MDQQESMAYAYLEGGRKREDKLKGVRNLALHNYCFQMFTRAEDPRNRTLGDLGLFVYEATQQSKLISCHADLMPGVNPCYVLSTF